MMFDFKEYYDKIAEEMPDDCRVCEVGVADGISAIYLANRLHELGKIFKLYMVDDMSYGAYEQMKTIYENIIKSGLGNSIEVVPCDSVRASEYFNGHSLDFVFIDSSHEYQETKDSIINWYGKVKDEGILAGHDYFGHEEVKKAVDELIPEIITRDAISAYDNFDPEQLLFTEETQSGFGIWYLYKRFYWKP